MSRANFREVFTGASQVIPELPLVGWARLDKARVPGLEAHAHGDAFEFFLFERGDSEWWVEGEVHHLSANQLYINRPGEVHGSVGESLQPCGYYWINLAIPASGLPGMTRDQSKALCREIASMQLRTFVGSPELKHAFEALWKSHRERPAHSVIVIRAQLHLLLARLLHDYRMAMTAQSPARKVSYAIRKAIEAIDAGLGEIKTIAELARISGLGVTQFRNRFLSETGFTPATYLRRQRIERAKTMLRARNGTLADIAQEVGFSSSQHLATVFKQLEGITPTVYTKGIQKKSAFV